MKTYDVTLASTDVIRLIPRIAGPILSKTGKFPSPVPMTGTVADVIEEQKRKIKFHCRKHPVMNVSVGHVLLSPEQLTENLCVAIEHLITLTGHGWDDIERMHIKSTMGKPHRIY